MDKYNFNFDFAIINHGAMILDSKGNVIYNVNIQDDIVKNIINDLKLENTIYKFGSSGLNPRVDITSCNLNKIHTQYKERNEAMCIKDNINKKYSAYVNSYFVPINAVEIISNKTNKSSAISLIINKLNIKKENVYTIGDGYNDIDMIRDYNGYCMENSVKELEQIAKSKVSSVSDLINNIN